MEKIKCYLRKKAGDRGKNKSHLTDSNSQTSKTVHDFKKWLNQNEAKLAIR